MRVRIALGAAAAALAALILLTLAGSKQRISGSNRVPNPTFAATIPPHSSICQRGELVPADTAALRMTIASYGQRTPPVSYDLRDPGGAQIASGSIGGGFRQGVVDLPLAGRVRTTRPGTRFCLTDAGSVRIALAGVAPYGATGARLELSGGSTPLGALRIDYLRPGRESWLSLAGVLAYRFTLGKGSLVAGWAWAGALVLMLAVAVICARALVLSEREA